MLTVPLIGTVAAVSARNLGNPEDKGLYGTEQAGTVACYFAAVA